MAWGLDDLAELVNGLKQTINGKPRTKIEQNIRDAIVDPGKMLADFSGVTQGIKGSSVKASNKDKSLALLSLMGLLGGQEAAMGLKAALTPEYVYGLHVSPIAGLGKIKAKPPGRLTDIASKDYAYFWDAGKNGTTSQKSKFGDLFSGIDNKIADFADEFGYLNPEAFRSNDAIQQSISNVTNKNPLDNAVEWGKKIKRATGDEPTYYATRSKAKNVSRDDDWMLALQDFAKKSKKNLKVLDSVTGSNVSYEDLVKLMKKKKP